MIDVAVVKPFQATLNFLGGAAQNLIEHPDLVLEMLGGILGIVGGTATIVGGGGLEVVTVGAGTPVAVPAIVGGATLAAGGAALLGDSMHRLFNEANTDPRRGVDRGDGRDNGGHFTARDPDAPIPDYARKEQQGLDQVEADLKSEVIRDKTKAHVPGERQNGRFYDGLVQLSDGTYAGVEIKSGGAYSDYLSSGGAQKHFDDLVRGGERAYATLNGERVEISAVIVNHVP